MLYLDHFPFLLGTSPFRTLMIKNSSNHAIKYWLIRLYYWFISKILLYIIQTLPRSIDSLAQYFAKYYQDPLPFLTFIHRAFSHTFRACLFDAKKRPCCCACHRRQKQGLREHSNRETSAFAFKKKRF